MGYPTKAVWSMGSFISQGDGASPEVFTRISEVSKLTAPSASMATIDTTNLDSFQEDGPTYSEFIEGITTPGDITFTLNYQPNEPTHLALQNMTGTHNFQITYPKVGTQTAPATLLQACIKSKFDITVDEKNQLVAAVTLTCSGAPIFTPGTP